MGRGPRRGGEERLVARIGSVERGRGTGRRTGLSPDRGYKWAKQRSVRMPRAPVAGGVAADKYVSRQHHAAAYHAALAPSVLRPVLPPLPPSSSPPPPPPNIYLSCSPRHTVSRLCFTLAAHLNIMEMSTRDPRPGTPNTPHLSYTLMSSRGLVGRSVGRLVGWLNTSACAFSTCRNR